MSKVIFRGITKTKKNANHRRFLVGLQHTSLEFFEAEIEQLHLELDDILLRARERFAKAPQ